MKLNDNYIVLIFISVISLVSINAQKKELIERKCKSILTNNYANIKEDTFVSIIDKDTIYLNEVKYECVHTALLTAKVMYDVFGKWNHEIYPTKGSHPTLVWEQVKLFDNDTTEFTVATTGLESFKSIYASILVFDKKNNDLLSGDSNYKTKLIAYFSNLIKTNKSYKRKFYEVYWKTVDPKYWKRIKSNHKKQ
ncbi:hypothetical protein [Aquimarina sp. 2201CG14-23]|uniref:hypothetical protein n=1 Tax=Aquimarina mycalae TaxID=3040073 RepID=UPI002477D71B|nr:hypothetical protein [Aquimarina sp. 2201CG14-23]MDH7444813.1 hypothetical protein [Aquimarina sp. 2201CG14-23]